MVPRSGGEPSGVDKSAVESLENQLASTQALLAAHVERIKGLESTFAELHSIKDQVNDLHVQLQDTRPAIDLRQLPNVRAVDDDVSITSGDTAVPESDFVPGAPDEPPTTISRDAEPGTGPEPEPEPEPEGPTVLERIAMLERAYDTKALQERVATLESQLANVRQLPQEVNDALNGWRDKFEHRWEEERRGVERRRPSPAVWPIWLLAAALSGVASAYMVRWLWVA